MFPALYRVPLMTNCSLFSILLRNTLTPHIVLVVQRKQQGFMKYTSIVYWNINPNTSDHYKNIMSVFDRFQMWQKWYTKKNNLVRLLTKHIRNVSINNSRLLNLPKYIFLSTSLRKRAYINLKQRYRIAK